MKRTVRKHPASTRRIRRYAYPNAADPAYFINRLSEGILATVTCMGTVTLFLLVMTL